MSGESDRPPLVIFALDSGDAGLIERWAGEGYLPAIDSIMRRGSWGRLVGPEFVSEHGVWVSLFSGISRGRHGYYHWRPLRPGTYDLRLTDLRDVAAPPFWSSLRGRARNVVIIDAPEIRPLAGLSGFQVANWAPHNPRYATCAEPAGLLEDLHRRFGPPRSVEETPGTTVVQDRRISRGLLAQIEQKGALCRHLLTRDRIAVAVLGFFEPHVAGHQFWRYHSQTHAHATASTTAGDPLSHALRDVYQAIDRQIGSILAELPCEANVAVVTNGGIQEDHPSRALTEAFCHQLGYQVRAEAARWMLGPWDLVRRVIPERWRIGLSRRLPRRSREKLLADQFRSETDWSRTRVFALPSFYTGFLRVNLRGREPEGIVEPGDEYRALLDRVEADLRQLVDPESGQPAVRQIARTVELFDGGPPLALPDVFFEWAPTSYWKRRVVHPRAVLTQEPLDFVRDSHHTHHGFVAAAGPSIVPGRSSEMSEMQVLDLAPTFLALLGEPVPDTLGGNVLEAMIRG